MVVGVLGGLALALLVAPPLLLRGPVLRWAVWRGTRSLCGGFTVGGGHVGWAAVPQLVRGRPVDIVLRDVTIAAPDGAVRLAVAEVEGAIEVHAWPGRLVIDDAVIAHGRWELAIAPGSSGFLDAFRPVPAAGRDACLPRPGPHPAAARRPPPRPAPRAPDAGPVWAALAVRHLELRDLDVGLEFPVWGLTLKHARASGTVATGGNGPALLFDARGVVADGGTLRVGQPGGEWTTQARFDAVEIARVAVTPDAPTDLRLQVARATTGPALLQGVARFVGIFPAPARPGAGPPSPPGLALEAHWHHIGGALAALKAGWRPEDARLGTLDGEVTATLSGPFNSLSGALGVVGPRFRIDARVARSLEFDLSIKLEALNTTALLERALWPLLGGHLSGRLDARARIAPALAGLVAEVYDTDLRLERFRPGPWPRHVGFCVGLSPAELAARPSHADAVQVTLARARLARATLHLDGIHASWQALRADGQVAVAFPTSRGQAHVETRFALTVPAVERWIPGRAVTGALRFGASAAGPIDRLQGALRFPARASVSVLGQRFILPATVAFGVLDGDQLVVPELRVAHAGGGEARAGGRVVFDGPLTASVQLRDYPIADVPGLDQVPMPAALGGGASRPLAKLIAGTLEADLQVAGDFARPIVSGDISVAHARLDGRPLGDARIGVHAAQGPGELDATLDGTLNPGVSFSAHVRRGRTLRADARLTLEHWAVGPWLPRPLTGAALALTGHAAVALRSDAALSADGAVELNGPGLEGVALSGRVHGDRAEGRARGQIELERWPALWSPWLARASGAVAVDITLAPPATTAAAAHPLEGLAGRIGVARAVTLQGRGWPMPVTVGPGGRVDVAGSTVSTPGLSIGAPGVEGRVAGRAVIDSVVPARTQLALAVSGQVDAASLAARAHLPQLRAASGRLTIDAKVTGQLDGAPGPRVDGRLGLQALCLTPAARTLPTVTASGDIEAHGDLLSAHDLRLEVADLGTLVVGPGTLPAHAHVVALSPPRLGEIDLPLRGQHLTVGGHDATLAVHELDVDVRLRGHVDGDLTLTGDVYVAGAALDPRRATGRPRAGPRRPWYQSLPPHLTIDLTLRGPRNALVVAVPALPDVTVGFQCHLVATNRGASLTGRIRGSGVYSRAAIALYDWFTPGDLRGCQIGGP